MGAPVTLVAPNATSGTDQVVGSMSNPFMTSALDPLLISMGKFPKMMVTNKFGRNPDLDSGTEDLWNSGGTYTGFPTGSPEEIQIVSSSASDTGMVMFAYLANSSSTVWQTATATLNGTTPVNTGVTAYRVHTAQYSSGNSTGFNQGEITIRHRTTVANVFAVMPALRSQTNVCAYTVPAGSTGYITRLFGQVKGTTTAQVDFDLWVRPLGGSPRLRRPNSAVNSGPFQAMITGGLVVPAGTDIKVQITTVGNNIDVIGGFDIILDMA